MMPQIVEDVVQINIYGATLAGMLHNGVNLPRLLGKYGYSDCVVFDVPRRKGPWDHSMSSPSAFSYTLLPDSRVYEEEGLQNPEAEVKEELPEKDIGATRDLRNGAGVDPLMNCSLSTICRSECPETRHREIDEDFGEGVNGDEITPIDVKPLLPTTSLSAAPNTSPAISSSVADCLLDLLDRVTEAQPSNTSESGGGNVERTADSFDQWLNAQEMSPSIAQFSPISARSATPTLSATISVKKEISFSSQEVPNTANVSPCAVKSSDSSEAPLVDHPAVSSFPAVAAEEQPISSTFKWPPGEAAGMDIPFYTVGPVDDDWRDAEFGTNGGEEDIFMSPRSETNGRFSDENGGENEEFLEPTSSPHSHSTIDEFFDCSALEMNDAEDWKEDNGGGEEGHDDFEDLEQEEEGKRDPLSEMTNAVDAVDEDDDMDEFMDPFDMNIPAAKRAKLFHSGKKFACHFENCKKEILWKPHYGRNRFLVHVQTHWARPVFKCFFCDFKAGNEAKIRYHHKKSHADTPWKKMVNCETAEDTEELLKLWRKCFPRVTGPSNLVKNAAVKRKKS